MKILLTAINAKYIHSNLAVYSLRAYAVNRHREYDKSVEIAEYTINQQIDGILMDLYKKKPDVICFSCYLWNIVYVEHLVKELPKILPETEIWLGGPEVSFHAEKTLQRMQQVKGIMCGEGEETFLELLEYYHGKICSLRDIDGIVYAETPEENCENEAVCVTRNAVKGTGGQRNVIETPPRREMNLSDVPFVYDFAEPFCSQESGCTHNAAVKDESEAAGKENGINNFRNKIIYYESSRGCPFSCSYCLSSIDKCLRFRDLELVKRELQFFIDAGVPQVKFVDRTFNCRHDHAMTVWGYIKEHDRGITNFHFEVAADLLREDELELIASMRPGLIQLEIGVQSTNQETLREIRRVMDFEKVKQVVRRVHAGENIHQHLDLIAGLPFEDYDSFRKSFNDVYELRPNQLQLGFLKVLKGSYMEEKAQDYRLVYQELPPFEVLSTKWLSYSDVIRLKGIEEMVEVYYNSSQFSHTMELLEKAFPDAFSMYESLSSYYEEHGLFLVSHTRAARYEILLAFAEKWDKEHREAYQEQLTLDYYLRENAKTRPAFAGEETVTKEEARIFYDREAQEHLVLKGYEKYDKRQFRKMTHLERVGDQIYLFDYQHRNVMNQQAKTVVVLAK